MAKNGIVKRNIVKEIAELDDNPDFRSEVHNECTTHSGVLQSRRKMMQSRLKKLYSLQAQIDGGKMDPKLEGEAYRIASHLATVGTLEALTLIADLLCIRTIKIREKDGKPLLPTENDFEMTSVGRMMRELLGSVVESAEDAAVNTEMNYRFLKANHPAVLGDKDRDGNGVPFDNPDIFAQHFSDEEAADPDEPTYIDEDIAEDVFKEEIANMAKAASERAAKVESKPRRSHSEGGEK